jgi:hypothetical protein
VILEPHTRIDAAIEELPRVPGAGHDLVDYCVV